jgi:hypothetical protein
MPHGQTHSTFTGAERATRIKIQHLNTNADIFGKLHVQWVDAATSSADVMNAATVNFESATVENLIVSTAVTTPQLVVNGGAGQVIVGSTVGTSTGANGVVVGSGVSSAANTIMIGPSNTIGAAGAFSIVIGQSNTVGGDHNIVLGQNTLNTQTDHVVMIGFGSSAVTADDSVIIGTSAVSAAAGAVVLGPNSDTVAADSIAIGNNASITGNTRNIAIGLNATVSGQSAIGIGALCSVPSTATSSIALGPSATVSGPQSVAIGSAVVALNVLGATALGANAYVAGASGVVVGYNGVVSGTGVAVGGAAVAYNGVSVGNSALSTLNGVALGEGANASQSGACALGSGVATRVANEFACPGMRVLKLTATTAAAPSTLTFFTLSADGEMVEFDAAVIAHNAGAAAGTEVVTFKLENYIGRRAAGLAIIDAGFSSSNNPSAKTYLVGTAVTSSNLQLSFTPGIDTVTWTAIIRIYGAPLI